MVKFTFPSLSSGFFNRGKEIKQITATILRETPQITVMLGPPSSGKTAFMRHIVEQGDQHGPLFLPIRLNLRALNIYAQESLYSSFLDQVSGPPWNLFGRIASFEIGGMSVTATSQGQKLSNLVELLNVLKSNLRTFDPMHGERPVVLVVDEANKFKLMENKDDLQTFLDFAVEVSKQESK